MELQILKEIFSKKIEITIGKIYLFMFTTLIVVLTMGLKNDVTVPVILILLLKALGITLMLIQMQTLLEVTIKAFRDYYRDDLFK
jgi:hypothetical protein